ncbi:hypothetical protein [Pantoea vagans]|uniref:hypothetical protein n=1 Tax=Pantoea vagans TaxID=470934 RepID=UPI00301979AA
MVVDTGVGRQNIHAPGSRVSAIVPDNAAADTPLHFYQWMMGMDNMARRHNQQRLRELSCQRGGEITFFCSHDARELDALQVNATLR